MTSYGSVPTFSSSPLEDGTFPFLLNEALSLVGPHFLVSNLVEFNKEETEFLCRVGSTTMKDNKCAGIGTVKGRGFPSAAPPLAMAVVAKESCSVCPAADRAALRASLDEWWSLQWLAFWQQKEEGFHHQLPPWPWQSCQRDALHAPNR